MEQTPDEILRSIIDNQIPREIVEEKVRELQLLHAAKVLKIYKFPELSELCLAKHRELYEV